MSMTDPIADFLTRMRNAIHAAHETVEIPSSKLKTRAGADPQGAGLHRAPASVTPEPDGGRRRSCIEIRLKYTEDRQLGDLAACAASRGRAGARTSDAKHIPKVLGGMGTAIVSTSRGVMTGHEARAAGVGGEVLAQVW